MDKYTGLLNREGWDARVASALDGSMGHAIALLVLDLDHFKAVNDRYGHPVGDAVLRVVAATLAAAVRREDIVGRYGGDEFMALLPGANRACAQAIAERIRKRIRNAVVEARPADGCPVVITELTASVGGVALSASGGTGIAELVRRADANLLNAKRFGKDRVLIEDDGSPPRTSCRPKLR
ncbi:GGDEF domain-containing protein [Amycolatopsis rubida]|uniref:GGDEF domain-containing protein n=1 Tax=Amycolatopsis rubida TaxID=112413 RepID=A0ABX0BXJ1_9PSEU|nr:MULTISPECIES: GGDEF domain-containing protein [Amycolatopsis]MYW90513.1 diguanylate cyclase [Amycolatopsis rubida]MYW95119.1 diguanylate cyclase [Amycolatopsis rubida]NEC55493.1 GGDEF domain-containing protein [Amycolatopsis rubida]NEC60106.1 GGDEF domain-containing protein [Amycolatopsis rubida]